MKIRLQWPFRKETGPWDFERDGDLWYISGPMTGYPEFNYPYFTHVALELRLQGKIVMSPHEIDQSAQVSGDYSEAKPYGYYFKKAMQMLLYCNQIIMLPGWRDSKGACVERQVAELCGMGVFYLHELEDGDFYLDQDDF